jgi:3-dehydroquinate dehydratase
VPVRTGVENIQPKLGLLGLRQPKTFGKTKVTDSRATDKAVAPFKERGIEVKRV